MGRWGDAEFRARCEAFIGHHRIQDRVAFLGVKRDGEKLERFAQCDIFCFPSHFEAESFGLVLLEAMQFAKPVVSTWWRGIPSVVQDGVNGSLVPVEDADAVADRLMDLVNDKALRQRMGEEGRRIFAARFTLERFRQNMEAAIMSAIRPERN
jgi:glycosyltransferase involved in cell wall biosynthesis